VRDTPIGRTERTGLDQDLAVKLRMALVHEATLTPSKLELLAQWLPSRSWFREAGPLERIGSYRFDDPAGETGIECIIVQSGVWLFQVPLTYRGAPLAGAETHLVGTMHHSVLGPRWIYDGCNDPVAIDALATAILTGASEAIVELEVNGRMAVLPQAISVRGSGNPANIIPATESIVSEDDGDLTRINTRFHRIELLRVIDTELETPLVLTGSWEGYPAIPLAGLTLV
jgi:Maltokinase N-terminal cap domain